MIYLHWKKLGSIEKRRDIICKLRIDIARMRCDMNLVLLKDFLDYCTSIEFEILLGVVC